MTTAYKGLLCDFDGTLHVQDQHISEGVTQAVKNLVNQGIPFGICTGRQFEFIQPFIQDNDLNGVHVVCCGSQLVDSQGKVIQERRIPAATMQAVVQIINDADGYLALKHTGKRYGNATALLDTRSDMPMRPLSEVIDWATPSFYVRDIDETLWKILDARTDMKLYRQRFRSGEPGYFADGVANDVSKATGVLWWCAYHHLDPQTVIAIGDGENDLELLQTVGLGLAMGNAVPELRAVADEIIPSVHADGVQWAIEHYFNQQIDAV